MLCDWFSRPSRHLFRLEVSTDCATLSQSHQPIVFETGDTARPTAAMCHGSWVVRPATRTGDRAPVRGLNPIGPVDDNSDVPARLRYPIMVLGAASHRFPARPQRPRRRPPTPVDPQSLAHHRQLIVHAARIGATDSPPGKVGNKHRALARRLIHRIEDYLRFATDPNVPWDNNPAEREIRMPKLRQKISGGMRTLTAAEHFAAPRSYIATIGKHGIDTLDALTRLTTGNSWIPETT